MARERRAYKGYIFIYGSDGWIYIQKDNTRIATVKTDDEAERTVNMLTEKNPGNPHSGIILVDTDVRGVARKTTDPGFVVEFDIDPRDRPYDMRAQDRIAVIMYDLEKAAVTFERSKLLKLFETGEEFKAKVRMQYHDFASNPFELNERNLPLIKAQAKRGESVELIIGGRDALFLSSKYGSEWVERATLEDFRRAAVY